jgi:hypothetical protein
MWSAVFSDATKIANVHKDDPFFQNKRTCSGGGSSSSSKRALDEDDSKDDSSGFHQPKKLAQFVRSTVNHGDLPPLMNDTEVSADSSVRRTSCAVVDKLETTAADPSPLMSTTTTTTRSEIVSPPPKPLDDDNNNIKTDEDNQKGRLSLEERCAKQICRAWLKNHFLSLGQVCHGECGRLHEIVGNPERLYKDFSFKGLNPKHQKLILNKVKEQQSRVISVD